MEKINRFLFIFYQFSKFYQIHIEMTVAFRLKTVIGVGT